MPLHGRVTADTDGGFVVFLIGMHVNRWREVRHVAATVSAMRRMLGELDRHPELGVLRAEAGFFFGGPGVIQYWRSYEDLERYARAGDAEHLPAWRRFNALARTSDAVGIYHETYRVDAGTFETFYNHMPSVGLLAAAGPRALSRGSTSAQRIGARAQDEAPVGAPAGG
ncbi:DUF4188 domain-containing protein [Kineococcus sp. T13]|uniref:DUF4188 domain-containing protein n=1 Tax=Kineococcus vitellinus TaxID=2696565 RepID=UPI0014129DD0|nr:DUF4188 domain-containing protein [Kineococcus vitellinus]NAZ76967.1 DUF4188 domain-containing protein [Kineococcus vitellinus]